MPGSKISLFSSMSKCNDIPPPECFRNIYSLVMHNYRPMRGAVPLVWRMIVLLSSLGQEIRVIKALLYRIRPALR